MTTEHPSPKFGWYVERRSSPTTLLPKDMPIRVGPFTHAQARKTALEAVRDGLDVAIVHLVKGQEVRRFTPIFPRVKASS